METTKEKKVRPNKKVLLRGIAENSNNFNLPSLERTNIQNLEEIDLSFNGIGQYADEKRTPG